MNKPVADLIKEVLPGEDDLEETNRTFSVHFAPDKNYEDFNLGMSFHIVSVNRSTGEVVFSLLPPWIRSK